MAEQSVAPAATIQTHSADQLHARACFHCGREDGELSPAGYVRIENRPGQDLVWAVVACPEHQLVAS